MYDIVIRGGVVLDGTGVAQRRADVAVLDGLIAMVGDDLGPGHREINADGLLVTPGFVDIHTHYDGQVTWDPDLTPSCWHGVTTTVFGNCGVGFAPVKPGTSKFLINLMEGVEDIPETVLSEGVKFNWESFPEYLEEVGCHDTVMDVGVLFPHSPLRFYVMGDRGADHTEEPTCGEMTKMGELLEAGLVAGAMGFSTSRTRKHRAADGRPVPSLSAREAELFSLAEAMRRAGRGVLQVNSDFGPGEFEILQQAARISGRPLSCLLLQIRAEPDLWRQTLRQINAARAEGIEVTGQVGARAIGLLIGLETSVNPFLGHPAWEPLKALTPRARYERLRDDGALRERLLTNPPAEGRRMAPAAMLSDSYVLGSTIDCEPSPGLRLGVRAQAEGRSVWDMALEEMMADGGKGLLMFPIENYAEGSFDSLREMLTDDGTVLGLGDGGAHVGTICDASGPTALLCHWGRDRTRGPRIPLEYIVRKQTHDGAAVYGLTDRGTLQPGKRADINVIDFAALKLAKPQVQYDLPNGGMRLSQRPKGYRHTFVSGVETLCDDELTGARPGKLIRN